GTSARIGRGRVDGPGGPGEDVRVDAGGCPRSGSIHERWSRAAPGPVDRCSDAGGPRARHAGRPVPAPDPPLQRLVRIRLAPVRLAMVLVVLLALFTVARPLLSPL